MGYKSTKLFNGFTCCFRQWKAVETHCKYLHGYAVSFKLLIYVKIVKQKEKRYNERTNHS